MTLDSLAPLRHRVAVSAGLSCGPHTGERLETVPSLSEALLLLSKQGVVNVRGRQDFLLQKNKGHQTSARG